jgi:hypothetical protein
MFRHLLSEIGQTDAPDDFEEDAFGIGKIGIRP